MSEAQTRFLCTWGIVLVAFFLAGCSESPEEQVYQAYKCAKAAMMLGEDGEAEQAMRSTNHLMSKIDTGGSPARYGMAMAERFQDEVPLYANNREGQFQLLLAVYESSRCKDIYGKQEGGGPPQGIPEHVPGDESETEEGSGQSDNQSPPAGAQSLSPEGVRSVEVTIDPPTLGSEAETDSHIIIRPTQVFQPEDTIYLSVPTRNTELAEHRLRTRWTFHGGAVDSLVYEDYKIIRSRESRVLLFRAEKLSGWSSGRYTIEIQLDGQTMRAVSFTVAEPAQSSPVGVERSPSRGCTTVPTPLGKALCSDGELAALDRTLDELFSKAKAASRDPWELDQSQGQWRNLRRDACNGDFACLKEAYEDRISALSSE